MVGLSNSALIPEERLENSLGWMERRAIRGEYPKRLPLAPKGTESLFKNASIIESL